MLEDIRTYCPPRWTERAERAYQDAPRRISMGCPNVDGPTERSYRAAQSGLSLADKKPRPIPGSNCERVRRVLAENGPATTRDVYMRLNGGYSGLNHQTVRSTLNNLCRSGHVTRLDDGRMDLTDTGRALVEGE